MWRRMRGSEHGQRGKNITVRVFELQTVLVELRDNVVKFTVTFNVANVETLDDAIVTAVFSRPLIQKSSQLNQKVLRGNNTQNRRPTNGCG